MPRTKSLKQLAIDYEVSPATMMYWLHKKFPHWYHPKRVKGERLGTTHPNKRTYFPKEVKLIYEHFGEPSKE